MILFVLAVAGTIWFYHREAIKLTPVRRWQLIALRIFTFSLILFLILKPVLNAEFSEKKSKPIWLLLDNTGSMTSKDTRLNPNDQSRVAIAYDKVKPNTPLNSAGSFGELSEPKPTRLDLVKAVLNNPRLNLIKELEEKGPLQGYLLGLRSRGVDVDDTKALPQVLNGTENRTSLLEVIHDLLKLDDSDLPAAIVVMSDGRDNSSTISWSDLAAECKSRGVPLHIYGVGVTGNGFLQIREASVPETQFVEDTVTVPVRWRCEDLRDGEVDLSLRLNDRIVASKRVRIKPGLDQFDNLNWVPEKKDTSPGKQEMTVTASVVGREDLLKDLVKKSVRIVDRKIKLLFIEQTPRWEFKFIQRALLRDRRVESTFLLVEGDPKAMEAGMPFLKDFPATRKELFAYDMLIIGDVNERFFTKEQQEWIKDFVSEGGGLVMIAGRKFAPASYDKTPLSEVLPVEFRPINFPAEETNPPEEYQPKISDTGERNGLLALADTVEENARIWKSLPGWYWYYPITKLKPGAISLLQHPKAKLPNEDRPMPLLAAHYFGKGLVLFCGFEESWRWRLNEEDKYFGRFWGQVIYQVGLPHSMGSKAAQIQLEQGETEVGKPTRVFARLFNADYRPLTSEKIKAKIERLDAGPNEPKSQEIILESVPNQPGEYITTLPNEKVGKYQLRITDGLAEPATLDFRVSLPTDHEMAPGGMNEDALRELATSSGGAFYREEDLHTLTGKIQDQSVTFYRRREVLLWNRWLLGLVVVFFTAEWLLRKYSNMS